MYPSMKNQRTKYIKVRMTPEEVQQFKKKSASYSSVSHYIRSALAEYSNIGTKRQLELMNDLGLFYRKYQNELSWAGASNVPNPCIEIIFPSSNCRVISASNEATSSEVSFNVYPNLRDNSEVNSLLFKM